MKPRNIARGAAVLAIMLTARVAGAEGTCLPANTLSNNIRDEIVGMVTSPGARGDSGRTQARLPSTTADSVVLMTSDSLCALAAAARARAHAGIPNPPSYPLWLFKVGAGRYAAYDIEYKSGEFDLLDILDESFARLATIAK